MFGIKGLGFVGLGFNGFSSVRVVVHGLVYREAKPQPNGLLSYILDMTSTSSGQVYFGLLEISGALPSTPKGLPFSM